MGLRVESCNGRKLNFSNALSREWQVLQYGLGWGIPIWRLWRAYKSYKEYEDQEMNWDLRCEYLYDDWTWRRKGAALGCICVIIALMIVIGTDSIKPRYRGENLTIAQFAANYNYYYGVLNETSDKVLLSDGTKTREGNSTGILDVFNLPLNKNAQLLYQVENGYIRSITYENTWTDVFLLGPLQDELTVPAIAAVMAQRGMSIEDLNEFSILLEEQSTQQDAQLIYENIEINWSIETDNCEIMDGVYMCSDETKESSLKLCFKIDIHP